MVEAKLPTKEELEKLYQEKGHDALVWFAWRNALRALPLTAHFPLVDMWPEDRVRHIYTICCVPLLLSQWPNIPKTTILFYAQAVWNASSHVKQTIKDMIRDKPTSNYCKNNCSDVMYAIDIAANTANTALATNTYKLIANTYSTYVFRYSGYTAFDYTWLLQHSLTEVNWHSQTLWPKYRSVWSRNIEDSVSNEFIPDEFIQNRQVFTQQLQDLGLDFLAQDLNALWEGKPLGAHALNYLNEYSETVLNDPVALRRAILGKAQVEQIHAVRVLLLGPGGAGKSSLADRLQGKVEIEVNKTSTQGIYLSSEKLNLNQTFPQLDLPQRELDLYLWDFGGQTIFHGLHSAFLHENCVYVLVVDSRHEQAPDYWLQQIRHLTDAKAKVLLVTNWHEFCETKQNETRLLREFGDLLAENCFFYFSCYQPQAEDFKKFLHALVEMASDSQRMVLKETLDAQVSLKQLYKDNIFLEVDQLDDLLEQLPKRLGEVSQLKANLEQLGFIIFVDGDKQDYCLNPVWSVTKAYAILSSKVLRQANGLLKLAALQEAFKNQIERKYIKFLVELLQTRLLCRKVEFDNCYFFPDAAPTNEPATLNDLLQQENKLSLRFDLDHLPLGLHAHLVHHLFKPHCDIAIKNVQSIWRHGFILQSSKAQAIVQYILPKSSIEFIMLGDVKEFASLVGTFYRELKNNVTTKETIKPNHIHAFVCGDTNQLFAVHSAQELVKVLEQVTDYDQLFEVVRKMLGTGNITVINGQFINGNNNEQISNSHNKTP